MEIPFDKQKEIKLFGKFVAQLVREAVVFRVEFNANQFIVVLTGGF